MTARPASAVRGRWAALGAVAAARAAFGFQFQALPALAPAMRADLGLSIGDVGLLTGLYMAPGLLVALAGGAALQRIGVREAMAAGLACMAAAGLLAALTPDLGAQAGARLLGGLGAALATVAGIKGAAEWFPMRELPMANSLSGAAQPFGIGCALAAFSALGPGADWQAAMGVTGALAAVALAAALVFVPRDVRAGGVAPSAWAVAGAVTRREWAALLSAGGVLALYVGCFYGFLSLFPSWLAELGWSPGRIALVAGGLGWAPVLISPLGGWIAARTGRPGLVIAVGVAGWGATAALLPVLGPSLWLLGLMAVFGPAPLGAVFSLPARAVAPERLGFGSGVFTSFMYLGATAMPALAGLAGARGEVAGASAPLTAVMFCVAAFLFALPMLALFERFARRA